MNARLSIPNAPGCGRPVRRVIWGAILLCHIAPLEASVSSLFSGGDVVETLSSLLWLLLSSAFFLLKIWDAPFLRLSPGRRSAVTSVLLVAMIHAGAVEHRTGVNLFDVPQSAALVVAVCAITASERVRQLLAHVAKTVALALQTADIGSRPPVGWADRSLLLSPACPSRAQPTAPRAPPCF